MKKINSFFANKHTIISLYFILALIVSIKQYLIHSINNYLIFKYTFWHTINLQNLYNNYPKEYVDCNHYGPFFAVIIFPFALLPDWLGSLTWNLFNTALLIWGIFKLPLSTKQQVIIAWICVHEFLTAILSFQFNVGITGLILLSFIYLEKQKVFLAAIAIMVGFFVKLYGIVGMAFFFFIKKKLKFLGSLIVISISFFCITMLFSNFNYVIASYVDWYHSLVFKSFLNETGVMTDISFFGFIRKTTGIHVNVLYGCLTASLFLAISLLRIKFYEFLNFRLLIVCYLLFCIVLFNTNVESPTYIIAFLGVGIWFIIVERNVYSIFLLVFALILTSLSPSDLFPRYLRENFVSPYALKALPCILIWLDVTYRILFTNNFNKIECKQ